MSYRIITGSRALVLAATLIMVPALPLAAQGRGGGGRGGAQNPKAAAPIDLTGYWVSIVDEDWRFRMVMPPAGDYMGVPMTAEAGKVAAMWDPAKDEASGDVCKAFGAPSLFRQPGHLHITWQDDQTLQVEMDAGKQTRLLHFGKSKPPAGPSTLQGDSVADWETAGVRSLKVETSHLKAGYLRKNGVPYSENATVLEYYDTLKERDGSIMLVVTTSVTDPQYLREPFIVTTHFKKQNSDAGWSPSACTAKW
jgi:hypothetical protein